MRLLTRELPAVANYDFLSLGIRFLGLDPLGSCSLGICPVAICITWTALATTSAGRLRPSGLLAWPQKPGKQYTNSDARIVTTATRMAFLTVGFLGILGPDERSPENKQTDSGDDRVVYGSCSLGPPRPLSSRHAPTVTPFGRC